MNRMAPDKSGCTVYLLRHGDSRPDAVRRFIGKTDHPLNETGREQAEYWCRALSHIHFNRICCSNLKRSVETARIIGRQLCVPITILPDLREIDLGRWDGMPVNEVRRQFPKEYEQRGRDLAGYRPAGGESFNDLSARVAPAFEEVVQQNRGDLLIVGHAGVNRTILCHLLGMPLANLFRLEQGYGCLNILEYAAGSWVILRLNIPAENNTVFPACQKNEFPL
ncbi:MAG: alpha-ribazole phosphatase [Pseudomonadota bacterium]